MAHLSRSRRRTNDRRRREAADKQAPIPAVEQVRRLLERQQTRREQQWSHTLFQAMTEAASTRSGWATAKEHTSYEDPRHVMVDRNGNIRQPHPELG